MSTPFLLFAGFWFCMVVGALIAVAVLERREYVCSVCGEPIKSEPYDQAA